MDEPQDLTPPPNYQHHMKTKKKHQYNIVSTAPTTLTDDEMSESGSNVHEIVNVAKHRKQITENKTDKNKKGETMISPMEIEPLKSGEGSEKINANANANAENKKTTCCTGNCLCDYEFYDMKLNKGQKRVCLYVLGGICCVAILLVIILILVSLRQVEFNEYAIRYNGLTKQTDSQEYNEGRYIFTPGTKLFLYDALIQKLSIESQSLTRDGILMQIDVDIQYSIPKHSVYPIWNEFGKEQQIDKYMRLVAMDTIRDAISLFPAYSFYKNRFEIQLQIEDKLFGAMKEANTHLIIISAVLSGYSYPDRLGEAIKIKRAAENEIEIAKNQRNGNITDAETNYILSKIYAQQMQIQTAAQVEALLNEAQAASKAVRERFKYIQQLFELNRNVNNFTGKQFVDHWLTSFVLLHAGKPITTTLDKNQYEYEDVVLDTMHPTILTSLSPSVPPSVVLPPP